LAVHVTKTNVAVKVVVYSIAETGIVLQVATVTNTNVAVKVVVYSIAETGIMLQVATGLRFLILTRLEPVEGTLRKNSG
jgi:hypothetical protein